MILGLYGNNGKEHGSYERERDTYIYIYVCIYVAPLMSVLYTAESGTSLR